MDKDTASRFVSILLGALRAEIAEVSARAERLGEAARHSAEQRERAAEVLARVRSQRAERDRRRYEAETAPTEDS